MIVRTLQDLLGTDAEVDDGNWVSRRFLLREDGMGFSLHDTVIRAGTETYMWYKHHLEAVYCIAGHGEVELVPEGTTFKIHPGTMYALNGHEKHYLRAHTEMRMICVFNPPVTGEEVHNERGVYPLMTEDEGHEAPEPLKH